MEHSPTDQDALLPKLTVAARLGVLADKAAVSAASAVGLTGKVPVEVGRVEVADEHDGERRQRETKRAWGYRRRGARERKTRPAMASTLRTVSGRQTTAFESRMAVRASSSPRLTHPVTPVAVSHPSPPVTPSSGSRPTPTPACRPSHALAETSKPEHKLHMRKLSAAVIG